MTHLICTFPSSVLGTQVNVDVLLPRPEDLAFAAHKKSPKPPFRCLYLLHGLRENGQTWLQHADLASLCDELSIAMILPSCGNYFYLDTPDGFQMGTYLTDELYTYTHEILPLSTRWEDNYIGGNSMGGFGACCAALQHPELYSRVISLSGALSVRKAGIFAHAVEVPFPASLYRVDKNAYDMTRLLVELSSGVSKSRGWDNRKISDSPAVPGNISPASSDSGPVGMNSSDRDTTNKSSSIMPGKIPSFWLSCPPSDLFYQENVNFYNAALENGIPCELHTPQGNHDWTFWKSQVADAFAFLTRPPAQHS